MLDRLRNYGRSWVAKVLIGILIVSVAAFGIPSIFLDLGQNTVGRVGDQDISARDFQRLYQGQLNQFAQQTGQMPTPDQALAFGLPGSILGRLANDAALEGLADRLSLGASEDRLAIMVRQDPTFSGALGSFDRQQFTRILQQAGYTEREYLNQQRRAAARQQIALGLFEGLPAPQVLLEIANHYENDQRTIEYIALNPVLYEAPAEPTEADLQAYLEDNQALFRTQETRNIRLLVLSAELLASGIEVSEADIAAEYERTISQFATIEQRTIHQVLLPDAETVASFEAGSAAGTDFESLLAEAGLEGNLQDLGTLVRSQVSDANLASTAFGLEEGGYAVIPGALGQRAVWVSEIVPAGEQPLEEVGDQIAETLRLARARDLLLDVYDEIEDYRAAFQPLDEIAERYGLEIQEIPLTRGGGELDAVAGLPPETRNTLIQQVFNASQDATLTAAVNLGANRTAWFDLIDVEPVRDQTLDEVRDAVVEAWTAQEVEGVMIADAEGIVAELEGGADFFTLANAAGQVPQASQQFTRAGDGTGLLAPDVVEAAFQGGEGHVGMVRDQNGDMVIFRVSEVIPADEAVANDLAALLGDSISDNLYALFVSGLQGDAGLRINQQALDRIIGLE